jgi:hypothetical protein
MPKDKQSADLAASISASLQSNTGEPLTAAQMDFLGCLIPALVAAVPAFLESFMRCLGGGSAGYNPSDEKRCD